MMDDIILCILREFIKLDLCCQMDKILIFHLLTLLDTLLESQTSLTLFSSFFGRDNVFYTIVSDLIHQHQNALCELG